MEKYKGIITDFIHSLTMYDYIGVGITFFLFMLFLILALIVRKHVKTSFFLMFLGFISFFIGPFLVVYTVHGFLYKHDVKLLMTKKLHYVDSLVIKGELHYEGKNKASNCEIQAHLHKVQEENFIKKFAHQIKPFKKGYTDMNNTFVKGTTYPFRILIEPFTYSDEYNITLKSECRK